MLFELLIDVGRFWMETEDDFGTFSINFSKNAAI